MSVESQENGKMAACVGNDRKSHGPASETDLDRTRSVPSIFIISSDIWLGV